MSADEKAVAAKKEYPLPGNIAFQQIVPGWSGSGFNSSYREIQACFVQGVAQISFTIQHNHEKRSTQMCGGMTLSADHARELALAIAPEIQAGWSTATPTESGLYAVIEPQTSAGTNGRGIYHVTSKEGALVVGFRRVEHFNPGTIWIRLPDLPKSE